MNTEAPAGRRLGYVCFKSLTERIETGSASGRLIFHVFAALAA